MTRGMVVAVAVITKDIMKDMMIVVKIPW